MVGKTTFGQNLLSFKIAHIAEDFNKLPESEGKNTLRNARNIFIDFTEYPQTEINEFTQWISYLIWINFI